MVQLASNESSLKLLMERLRWPLRLVRVKVAQEYGALLGSSKHGQLALKIYLDWISARTLESEVVSALSVLKCCPATSLPSLGMLRASINAPSILADLIVQQVYGYGHKIGGWSAGHSGTAPASFEPSDFFEQYKRSHVAPALSFSLERLERVSGMPFPTQWAFEWQSIMDGGDLPYSGFPHYFCRENPRDNGVFGQFSQRQDDVYRSAFLRAIAWGVSRRMPMEIANDLALDTLTLNSDFATINPIVRPAWLGSDPEDCCLPGANLEVLARSIISKGKAAIGATPISIKVPVSIPKFKYADLTITALLATPDFEASHLDLDPFGRKIWKLGEASSFNAPLGEDDAASIVIKGDKGSLMPLGLSLWPEPLGFWHGEYFSAGIVVPLSFVLTDAADVRVEADRLSISIGSKEVANWHVWHQDYSPLYPRDGHTRVGMLSSMSSAEVFSAAARHARRVAWLVESRIWKSEKDYGLLEPHSEKVVFFD